MRTSSQHDRIAVLERRLDVRGKPCGESHISAGFECHVGEGGVPAAKSSASARAAAKPRQFKPDQTAKGERARKWLEDRMGALSESHRKTRDQAAAAAGLTPLEAAALHHYSDKGYIAMNVLMRGKKPPAAAYAGVGGERLGPAIANEAIVAMQTGFAKLPAYSGPLERGIRIPRKEAEAFFVAGETYSDPSFQSASPSGHSAPTNYGTVFGNRAIDYDKAVRGRGQVNTAHNTVGVTIKIAEGDHGGRLLQDHSSDSFEKEVLLPPGAQFKVKRVRAMPMQILVDLEPLPAQGDRQDARRSKPAAAPPGQLALDLTAAAPPARSRSRSGPGSGQPCGESFISGGFTCHKGSGAATPNPAPPAAAPAGGGQAEGVLPWNVPGRPRNAMRAAFPDEPAPRRGSGSFVVKSEDPGPGVRVVRSPRGDFTYKFKDRESAEDWLAKGRAEMEVEPGVSRRTAEGKAQFAEGYNREKYLLEGETDYGLLKQVEDWASIGKGTRGGTSVGAVIGTDTRPRAAREAAAAASQLEDNPPMASGRERAEDLRRQRQALGQTPPPPPAPAFPTGTKEAPLVMDRMAYIQAHGVSTDPGIRGRAVAHQRNQEADEAWAAGVAAGTIRPPAAVVSKEDYIDQRSSTAAAMGDAIAAASPGGRTRMSQKQIRRQTAGVDARRAEIHAEAARNAAAAAAEWDRRAAAGEVRTPTARERLERLAAGHPDNESTQAAQRLLQRRFGASHPSRKPEEALISSSEVLTGAEQARFARQQRAAAWRAGDKEGEKAWEAELREIERRRLAATQAKKATSQTSLFGVTDYDVSMPLFNRSDSDRVGTLVQQVLGDGLPGARILDWEQDRRGITSGRATADGLVYRFRLDEGIAFSPAWEGLSEAQWEARSSGFLEVRGGRMDKAPKFQQNRTKRRCTIGYGCGRTCIEMSKECRITPSSAISKQRLHQLKALAMEGDRDAESRAAGVETARLQKAHELRQQREVTKVQKLIEKTPELQEYLRTGKAPTLPSAAAEPKAGERSGKVMDVPVSEIAVDPGRFQYKLAASSTGEVGSLSGVKKWDPNLAGVISVWEDPADGKTYVVNGHNRVALAKRLGAEAVTVRYLTAEDAKEARSIGAKQNIAEGAGTALDAGKYFRDTGVKTQSQVEDLGLPLTSGQAKQGLGLAGLPSGIFNAVVNGDLTMSRGAILGGAGLEHAKQKEIYRLMQQRKSMSNGTLQELVDHARATEEAKQGTLTDLLGETESESHTVARADLSNALKRRLNRERRLFGMVARSAAAQDLQERGGNVINREQSGQVAQEADTVLRVYDQLKGLNGPISHALNRGAAQVAAGADKADVAAALYQDILDAMEEEFRRSGLRREAPPKEAPGQTGMFDAAERLDRLAVRLDYKPYRGHGVKPGTFPPIQRTLPAGARGPGGVIPPPGGMKPPKPVKGKACGDSVIPAAHECHKARGVNQLGAWLRATHPKLRVALTQEEGSLTIAALHGDREQMRSAALQIGRYAARHRLKVKR